MSRYDFEPDDFLSQPVPHRSPTSPGNSFHTREQGDGNTAGDEQSHNNSRQNDSREPDSRESIQERSDERLDLERDPSLDLSDSEVRTLTDLGTFRSIKFDDLAHYRYGEDTAAARTELNRLARSGFIRRHVIPRSQAEVYALTRSGRQTLENRPDREPAQTLYDGLVKWREADHDTAVYKLFQKVEDDITRSGGRITRVVLDFELKRRLHQQLARISSRSHEEQAHRKPEIAEELGLKVINGRVAIPDLRLEYETSDHEQGRVDFEVVTGHYRNRDLAAKAAAGFALFASEADRARLRAAMADPEIMQEILSL